MTTDTKPNPHIIEAIRRTQEQMEHLSPVDRVVMREAMMPIIDAQRAGLPQCIKTEGGHETWFRWVGTTIERLDADTAREILAGANQ